jgi:hypothetical protein
MNLEGKRDDRSAIAEGGIALRHFSYGATSAVVTGMALVTGLDAASGTRLTIIAGLLIFAVADNLTDC